MIYKPIDYSTWDFSGKGKNIVNFLNDVEMKIWNDAHQYQDKRQDKGHAEVVTYFALELLKHIDGNREIVTPAAILHDIGWSQMFDEERKLFRTPIFTKYEPVLRERHQEEGVKLAKKLLKKYSQKFMPEILEIISKHDTRKGFYSKEDGVVRDADKLWRFTFFDCETGRREYKFAFEDIIKKVKASFDRKNFFYSQKSEEIARIEFNNTLKYYESKRK